MTNITGEQYPAYGRQFNLKDKVAIVTGSGRGLGKVMALALAEAGADIAVIARTKNQIEETKEEVIALGRRSIAITADLTKTADINNMVVKTIEQFGRIDILINNAGGGDGGPIENLTDEVINFNINVNFKSTIICCRAAGQHMIKQKSGKIINISSTAGQMSVQMLSIYGSAKAGIEHFTKVLAKEWARYNINVNCIAPGYFATEASIVGNRFDDEKTRATLLRKIPFRRFGEPEEIGPLAVYLASNASSFMTGSIITLDGGQTTG